VTESIEKRLDSLPRMSKGELGEIWRTLLGAAPPQQVRRELQIRILAYKLQEQAFGGLKPSTRRRLREIARTLERDPKAAISHSRPIKPGTRLIRQWQGKTYQVTVGNSDYEYDNKRYASLSEIARLITRTRWSGPLFFGLKGNGGSRAQ
jgi:Protein of unknown function (DUF2924)